MKVTIDYDLCMGDRQCCEMCPEVFEYDEEKLEAHV
jgi:ferredoxin